MVGKIVFMVRAFLLLILAFCFFSFQKEPYRIAMPAADPLFSVTSSPSGTLYVMLDNKLAIDKNIKVKNPFLVCGSDTLIMIEGVFHVKARKEGEVNVCLFDGNNGKNTLIGCQMMIAKWVNDPIVRLGEYRKGNVSKDYIIQQAGLSAELPGCDYIFSRNWTVIHFDMNITRGGKETRSTSNSKKFTEDQLNQIEKLKPGDRVVFENVKIIGPDGKQRQVIPIDLTII